MADRATAHVVSAGGTRNAGLHNDISASSDLLPTRLNWVTRSGQQRHRERDRVDPLTPYRYCARARRARAPPLLEREQLNAAGLGGAKRVGEGGEAGKGEGGKRENRAQHPPHAAKRSLLENRA